MLSLVLIWKIVKIQPEHSQLLQLQMRQVILGRLQQMQQSYLDKEQLRLQSALVQALRVERFTLKHLIALELARIKA